MLKYKKCRLHGEDGIFEGLIKGGIDDSLPVGNTKVRLKQRYRSVLEWRQRFYLCENEPCQYHES